MPAQVLEMFWNAIKISVETTAGWALAAAGPIFGIFLALYTGYLIWITVFEEDHHEHDDDEVDVDNSGANDEARDYWFNHPDEVD